jgi:adenylate cyclase
MEPEPNPRGDEVTWWNHSSLRTKIFVAFSALIVAVLLATLGFTQLVVSHEAKENLGRELQTTGQVFESLMKERAARLQTNSTLLASDFALKRVIATHFDPVNYDPATLASAGLSYRQRIGVELVWMTDEAGTLLAASPANRRVNQSIAQLSPLRKALETEEATTAVVQVDDGLYQLVAVPVFAPDVIGFLLLGQAIDDSVAARLKADTGSEITFLTPTRVFASSWAPSRRNMLVTSNLQLAGPPQGAPHAAHGWPWMDTPGLREAGTAQRNAPHVVDPRPQPFLAALDGERFLSLAVPIAANLPQPLRALVQGSYDKALAPLHALQWRILIIGILGLTGALLVGISLAAGIIKPVRALVDAMRRVLRGDLRHHAQVDRGDEIGFLARSFNEMVDGLQEREHIKNTFGRFVSRDVAAAVLDGRVPLGGERLNVSILFQDIRGFTGLSEKLDPTTLLRVLNQLFTEVVAAVEAEGGMVKQFTGDGVMALFGAPQPRTDHCERAVRAALGIVSRLEQVNILLQSQGVPALQIGVGLHTGEVVAGLIGPDERVEYGVVGEPVNLASRVEGLTKDLGATILVSRDIAARLGPQFVLGRAALLPVKGRVQPVEVVEVLAHQGAR